MDTRSDHHGEKNEGSFFGWITRLVHEHRGQLVGVARNEGLTPEEALDVSQETLLSFLILPQARRLVEMPEDSVKLLTVLARNVARNQRRRHHRALPHDPETVAETLADESDPPDTVVSRAETYVTAVGCMATLGQIQQAVVRLRLLDDVPGEEAAAMLGISASKVAVLLHRAKSKLRTCIGEEEVMWDRKQKSSPEMTGDLST